MLPQEVPIIRFCIPLVLAACGPTSRMPAKDLVVVGAERTVVIAHTNDLHAHFRPSALRPGEPEVGGFLALSAHVEALERMWGEDRLLLLDAGDQVSGTPLDEYEVDGVRGGAIMQFVGALGYDAWALGNHEFDRGMEHTEALVSLSPAQALSCNLQVNGEPVFPGVQPSKIFEMPDLKVGVIGATTEGVTRYTRLDLGGLEVTSAMDCVKEQALALRGQVDVLVVVSHLGVDVERQLAKQVPELDLIVGGHTHTRMDQAEIVNGVTVVQAGSYARSLGLATIVVKDGKAAVHWEIRDPDPSNLPGEPSAEMVSVYETWDQTLRRDWDQVIGQADITLTRSYEEESPMGRWVGELMVEGVGADVGVYNAGGLRADLVAGDVTRADLYQVFPFGNEVVTVQVTGGELIGLALGNAGGLMYPEKGRVIQQYGLSYDYRRRMDAPELISVRVGGKPVDPDGTYTVATSDFVVKHWPRLIGGAAGASTGQGVTMLELATRRIEERGLKALPPAGGTEVDAR